MRTFSILLRVNALSFDQLRVGDRVLVFDQQTLGRISRTNLDYRAITVTEIGEHRFAGTTPGRPGEVLWYDAKEVGLTPYSQTDTFSERFVVTFATALRVMEFNTESMKEYRELVAREPLVPTPAE